MGKAGAAKRVRFRACPEAKDAQSATASRRSGRKFYCTATGRLAEGFFFVCAPFCGALFPPPRKAPFDLCVPFCGALYWLPRKVPFLPARQRSKNRRYVSVPAIVFYSAFGGVWGFGGRG